MFVMSINYCGGAELLGKVAVRIASLERTPWLAKSCHKFCFDDNIIIFWFVNVFLFSIDFSVLRILGFTDFFRV